MRNNVMFAVHTHVYVHNQTGELGVFDKMYLPTGDIFFIIFNNKSKALWLTYEQFNKTVKNNVIIPMGVL